MTSLATREGVFTPSKDATAPAPRVSSGAVKVMAEEGVDITGHEPSAVDDISAEDWDLVVLMGPEVEAGCPQEVYRRREQWGVDDPYGGGDDDYREARDLIRGKVEELVRRMLADGPGRDAD